MPTRKEIRTLALGVVLLALLVSYVPGFAIGPVSVNTDTQEFHVAGWTGSGRSSDGEVFGPQTRFTTSWRENGDSEKMVAQARMKPDLVYRVPVECRYVWFVNTGAGWQEETDRYQAVPCPTNVVWGVWYTVESVERVLHTPVVGGVAVEFQILTRDFLERTWKTLARDEAHLVPGEGEIRFDRGTYEVGETATIRTCVGYSSADDSGGRWTVQLHGPETDAWTVPDNACTPDSSAVLHHTFAAPGQYRVRLLNTLNAIKDDDAAVVDDLALAPLITAVHVGPAGTRSVGDAMTVSIEAEPNPSTDLPITEYYFHIRQGPGAVIVDRWQSAPTYEFTVQSDGDLQINVGVKDAADRIRFHTRIDVQVEEPDTPWTWTSGGLALPWWLVPLLLGLFVAAIVILLVPTPLPIRVRAWLATLLMLGVAFVALVYVAIPWVDAWIRSLIPGG